MAWFLEDYRVFMRGLFADEGVLLLGGWGRSSGQWLVASGQLKQGSGREIFCPAIFDFSTFSSV
jgi:hypothetical protein